MLKASWTVVAYLKRVSRGEQYKQLSWKPFLQYLTKTMVAFCPFPKNLPEVEVK